MAIEAQLEPSKSTTCDDYAKGCIDTTADTIQSVTCRNGGNRQQRISLR
jgi:hypothetical protein